MVWQAQIEHHFTLIAANHMLVALHMHEPTFTVDPVLSAELKESRDLHEHWKDNMPVFNQIPRNSEPPRKSGKDFASRNPTDRPYAWREWNSKQGPMLTPHVSAAELHRILDRVEELVVSATPGLADYIPARPTRSPWADDPENNHWWPRPPDA